jgi:hypothetical protein
MAWTSAAFDLLVISGDLRFLRRWIFRSMSSGLWGTTVWGWGIKALRNVGFLPHHYTASQPSRPRREYFGLVTQKTKLPRGQLSKQRFRDEATRIQRQANFFMFSPTKYRVRDDATTEDRADKMLRNWLIRPVACHRNSDRRVRGSDGTKISSEGAGDWSTWKQTFRICHFVHLNSDEVVSDRVNSGAPSLAATSLTGVFPCCLDNRSMKICQL